MSYLSAGESTDGKAAVPLVPLDPEGLEQWKATADPAARKWVEAAGFSATAGQCCAVPGADGAPACWLAGMDEKGWLYQLAALPAALPEAVYRLQCEWTREQRRQACLGWGLASYRFERYKSSDKPRPTLVLDEDIERDVRALCEAQGQVRDLVNTPTEHMGPEQLINAVLSAADDFGADCSVVTGDDLLNENYPAIHAVGRASTRAPGPRRCRAGRLRRRRPIRAGSHDRVHAAG